MTLITRPTVQTSRLVRTREAAVYIAVSPKQLRRLVRLGEIQPIQRGNVWLFDVKMLDVYIERQQAAQVAMPSGNNGST